MEVELIDEGTPGTPTPAGAIGSEVRSDSGHGLVGMRERVALYGGELLTGSTRNGYRVLARLLIDEEQQCPSVCTSSTTKPWCAAASTHRAERPQTAAVRVR